MLKAITDIPTIKHAQKSLEKRINESLQKKDGPYTIGYHGGSITVEYLMADHRIWFFTQYQEDSKKYWNAFGLSDRLKINGSNSISVEINIPLKSSKQVSGLFAYDSETDNFVLLHRGGIGGSTKGITKEAFLEWYGQKMVTFDNEGRNDKALFVADLSSLDIAKQLSKFVTAISRFKAEIKEVNIADLDDDTLAEKAKSSRKNPKQILVNTIVYERNSHVVMYVKRRAHGKCDLCEKKAPFTDAIGNPYLECHHIEWLSDGGIDRPDNAVALCPNCHRKMHIIKNAKDVAILKKKACLTL